MKITVGDAAKRLGVSKQRIRNRIATNSLKATKDEATGFWMIEWPDDTAGASLDKPNEVLKSHDIPSSQGLNLKEKPAFEQLSFDFPDEDDESFECPQCSTPVKEGWTICPKCRQEFDWEGGQ